jgi:hypothetical protein
VRRLPGIYEKSSRVALTTKNAAQSSGAFPRGASFDCRARNINLDQRSPLELPQRAEDNIQELSIWQEKKSSN